jgi:hypothetical protein
MEKRIADTYERPAVLATYTEAELAEEAATCVFYGPTP